MPTYDYECSKCGHSFDAFQSMSEDPLVKCPKCGKNGLRRLIGAGLGVIFKGSGFYSTDSRKSSSAIKTSSDSSKSDGGSSSGESAKTETKKAETTS